MHTLPTFVEPTRTGLCSLDKEGKGLDVKQAELPKNGLLYINYNDYSKSFPKTVQSIVKGKARLPIKTSTG